MSGLRVGVLALQGDVREHVRVLSSLGASVVNVRRPQDLEGIRGLVLPGGESSVIDKLARAYGLRQPIRDAIAAGLPVLGTYGTGQIAPTTAGAARRNRELQNAVVTALVSKTPKEAHVQSIT